MIFATSLCWMFKLRAEPLLHGDDACQVLGLHHSSYKRRPSQQLDSLAAADPCHLPYVHGRAQLLTRRRGVHASFLYQTYIPEAEMGGDLAPPPGKPQPRPAHAAKGPPKVLHVPGPEGPIVKQASNATPHAHETKAVPQQEEEREGAGDDISNDPALQKEISEMKADIHAAQDAPEIDPKPAPDEGNYKNVPLWPPAGGTLPPTRPPAEDDDGWKPVKEAEPWSGPSGPGGVIGEELQSAEESASAATNAWSGLGVESKLMVGLGTFGAGLFLTLARMKA